MKASAVGIVAVVALAVGFGAGFGLRPILIPTTSAAAVAGVAQPTEQEAIRMIGNLATSDAALAPAELVCTVGIGSRVRVVFASAGPDIAIPLWTLDTAQPAGVIPWRYPEPSN